LPETQKRYVIVGTGGRGVSYLDALAGPHRQTARLTAICDLSPTRMACHNQRLAEKHSLPPVPAYLAADFERMIKEQKPDAVIVTTMDCTHDQYIIGAMELGCDVITEKPMTTDAAKARAIFQAIERTGRKLRVTFNARYMPMACTVRELMLGGVVGRPLAVDMTWMLDTSHGADYFRRWHREKDKSGGLLIHKASHHFDMINWWISSQPKTVYAIGDLKFYGETNALARGRSYAYDRYTGQAAAKDDPFALFLDQDPHLEALYLKAEKDSGYIRDRNVFGRDITAEDTMAITCRYRNGAIFNYSLVAYSPWEGLRVNITGDKGRLELYVRHGSHIIAGQSDDELAIQQSRGAVEELRIFPMFGVPYNVVIPKATGSHGGGDAVLFADMFSGVQSPDPLGRFASHVEGAAAILMGISANQSMATGLPVDCDELLDLRPYAGDTDRGKR